MRQREQDRRGSRSSAQGFQGTQTASKEYDCILVWDGITKVGNNLIIEWQLRYSWLDACSRMF